MKWFYWFLISIVLLAGITVSVYFGIQPKPVPKISLSGFENPEEMGSSILKRLRLEVQSAPILFLGVMPEQKFHYQVWTELLRVANEPNLKYDFIVVEKNLPYRELLKGNLAESFEELDLKDDFDRLLAGLKKAQEQKKRIAVLAPSIYASQLLKGNVVDRLKSEGNLQVVSFSTSSFPLNADQEKNLEIPCIMNDGDLAGSGKLGCMIVSTSRPLYRKKKVVGKYPGGVSQVGSQDYLVLFNSEKYSAVVK